MDFIHDLNIQTRMIDLSGHGHELITALYNLLAYMLLLGYNVLSRTVLDMFGEVDEPYSVLFY